MQVLSEYNSIANENVANANLFIAIDVTLSVETMAEERPKQWTVCWNYTVDKKSSNVKKGNDRRMWDEEKEGNIKYT